MGPLVTDWLCFGQPDVCEHEYAQDISGCTCTGVCHFFTGSDRNLPIHSRNDCENAYTRSMEGKIIYFCCTIYFYRQHSFQEIHARVFAYKPPVLQATIICLTLDIYFCDFNISNFDII